MADEKKLFGFISSFRVVVELCSILFAAGLVWATLSSRVSAIETDRKRDVLDISVINEKINLCEKTVFSIVTDVREIKTEQKYISLSIEELKNLIKEKSKGESK